MAHHVQTTIMSRLGLKCTDKVDLYAHFEGDLGLLTWLSMTEAERDLLGFVSCSDTHVCV